MVQAPSLTKSERIKQVLDHLGLSRVHLGSGSTGDWHEFATEFPGMVASAALLAPLFVHTVPAKALGPHLLVVIGNRAPPRVRNALAQCQDANVVEIAGYDGLPWDDVARDYQEMLAGKFKSFLADAPELEPVSLPAQEGSVAGVSYVVAGAGPPLVLLPIGAAPSQWSPLIEDLSKDYCTIVLGGPHLGVAEVLESRFPSPGYELLLATLFAEMRLSAGETLLEVGAGSGAAARWLARRTNGANRVTGLDINPYLLFEAAALISQERLGEFIILKEGNATALPFAEDSFDAALSITVFEECEADKGLAEMVRVTRPGGRIAVAVRAEDVPGVINLKLPPDLKTSLERRGSGVSEGGCADASLYDRFASAGIEEANYFIAAVTEVSPRSSLVATAQAGLSGADLSIWERAIAEGVENGTFFITRFLHCAVGTKPAM